MNPWIPVLVGAGVQLLVAAYVYGRLTENTKNNSTAIENLQRSDGEQWAAIGEVREDVARIEGSLTKVNGVSHGRL